MNPGKLCRDRFLQNCGCPVIALAPDALLESGGYGLLVEAEEPALCCPAERNTADPQDLAARQINRLRAIDNRGDMSSSCEAPAYRLTISSNCPQLFLVNHQDNCEFKAILDRWKRRCAADSVGVRMSSPCGKNMLCFARKRVQE